MTISDVREVLGAKVYTSQYLACRG